MAKGFGSMGTPWECRVSKVSRALWPMASTALSQGMLSPLSSFTPERASPSSKNSVTRLQKRTSPPKAMIFFLRLWTTSSSTSVPTWGLASYRMSSRAPKATNCSRIQRILGLLIPVFSFPSEKVPAPPSPNWTLLLGSRVPFFQKAATFSWRDFASSPRSRTMGRCPA